MTANEANAQVDEFLRTTEMWRAELTLLREIARECGLTEEWKWRQPCYSYEGRNILILGGLKQHCTLGFFKGALLQDYAEVLAKPGENTQSARVLRFRNTDEIGALTPVLKAYIHEAIELEKAGASVTFQKAEEFDVPEELVETFAQMPAFKDAFMALTPGRRRAYLLHFTAAKQSATRLARIEKNIDRIMDGFGLNDCTCGLSKRMPGCDGSHKYA